MATRHQLLKHRVFQYVGIILVVGVFGTAYWYFSVRAGFNTSTTGKDPLLQGLVGYWKLDDGSGTTATDSSGNGNNGTLVNGTAWSSGQVGGGVTFDGTDDAINGITLNGLDPVSTNVTIAFWAKPNSPTTASVLFAYNTNDPVNGINIHLPWSSDNRIYWDYGDATGAGRLYMDWNSNWNNTWSHWVFTSQGGVGQRIYRNGALIASDTTASTFTKNSKLLQLNSATWKDSLDEVRLYNRAFSDADAKTLFRTTSPQDIESGLVGYWPFDGDDVSSGTETVAFDRSGNNNNATLYPMGTGFYDEFTTTESWSEYLMTGSVVSDEYNGAITTTSDPQMYRSVTAFSPTNNVLQIRYKGYATNGPTNMNLFYQDTSDCFGYSSTCQQNFSITSDGTWKIINVSITDAEWADDSNITNIRLDPEGQTSTGTFYIDYIRFYSNSAAVATAAGKAGQGFANTSGAINDYATVPDSASLDITSAITLSAWAKADSFSSTSPYLSGLISKYQKTATPAYRLRFGDTTSGNNNKPLFSLNLGGTDRFLAGPTGLSTNQWYLITGTYDGSTMRLYVDGAEVANASYSGSIATNNDFISLGDDYVNDGGDDRAFRGRIDEFRIYNRALAASEITQIYQSGASDKINAVEARSDALTGGLTGYWRLDDGSGTSATDSTGNGNTGTLTSGPTWTTGQISGATNFDGSNDYTTVPNNTAFDFAANQDFTVSVWVKTTQSQVASTFPGIVTKEDAQSTRQGYSIVLHDATNDPRWLFSMFTSGTGYYLYGKSDVADGNWHLLTVTRTGSVITSYQDGVFGNSATASSGSLSKAIPFEMGRWLTTGHYFNGQLDEVRTYKRALSAPEVAELYRETNPENPDSNLIGYWTLDGQDTFGTTTLDRSIKGNAGTLTNTPVAVAGKVNQAFSFNGSTQYINSGNVSLSNLSTFTLSGWFSRSAANAHLTVGKEVFGSDGKTLSINFYSDGQTYLNIGDNGANIRYGSFSSNDTGWHHVVLAFDGTQTGDANRLKAYVDGNQQALSFGGTAGSVPAVTPTSSNDFLIGRNPRYSNYSSGKIDEVRAYTRTLSATEALALYENSRERKNRLNAADLQKESSLRGLIGYWKLDDGSGTSATDSSGNTNTGTLQSGPTWASGRIGGAASFDGTDDYISTTTSYTNPTNFSISAWFKTSTASGKKIVGFESDQTGAASVSYDRHIYIGTDGKVYFGWYSGVVNLLSSSSTYTDGNWHHVLATHNGSTGALYVDGVLQGTGSNAPQNFSGYWRVGSYQLGGSWTNSVSGYFPGAIDEVRLYDRALSADDASYLYHATSPQTPESGLVGYWSFNGTDISGTSARDVSGKGNTGTLTSGPAVTSGKSGQALSFDGSNDYVTIANNSAFDFGASQDFTVSAWVRTTQAAVISYYYPILVKDDGIATRNGYGAYLHNSNLDARWFFEIQVSGTPYGAYGASDIADGNWHHIVGMRSGSSIYTYQDGALANITGSVSTGSVSKSVPLNIGRIGGHYFPGKIDEPRVYNRALSAAEVKDLYERGK